MRSSSVLERVAGLGVAVGAAEVEKVVSEEREHVGGEVSRFDCPSDHPPTTPCRREEIAIRMDTERHPAKEGNQWRVQR